MQGMAPPPLLNQPPQIFGGYGHDAMPMLPPDIAAQLGFDPSLFDDVNDPKRRRIARVSPQDQASGSHSKPLTAKAGLRHVPQEEDQVRRQDAFLHALHQLQNRMCLYASREEADASERVCHNSSLHR